MDIELSKLKITRATMVTGRAPDGFFPHVGITLETAEGQHVGDLKLPYTHKTRKALDDLVNSYLKLTLKQWI